MRTDILEVIAEESPCGPDLDENFDDEYMNYFMVAEGLLPERYLDVVTGARFDSSAIKIDEHTKTIDGLLGRTKDIRLLSLAGKFQVLSGNIKPFCEILLVAFQLLDRYWQQVHPGADGDMMRRQNAMEAFDNMTTVTMPLEHATIVRTARNDTISYHNYAVAKGLQEKIGEEKVWSLEALLAVLRSEEQSEHIASLHESLQSVSSALEGIRSRFSAETDYEFVPNFNNLSATIDKLSSMLAEARPELLAKGAKEAPAANEAGDGGGEGADAPHGDGAPAALPAAVVLPQQGELEDIKDHATASAALEAIDAFFARQEPSTPALILVRQARQLIGKPLVEALQCLMPGEADAAKINLDAGQQPFALDMSIMRSFSETNGAGIDLPPTRTFSISNRLEANDLLLGVEHFFRVIEPSSPIPLLLQKARNFLSYDFSAILKEIIPENADKPSE